MRSKEEESSSELKISQLHLDNIHPAQLLMLLKFSAESGALLQVNGKGAVSSFMPTDLGVLQHAEREPPPTLTSMVSRAGKGSLPACSPGNPGSFLQVRKCNIPLGTKKLGKQGEKKSLSLKVGFRTCFMRKHGIISHNTSETFQSQTRELLFSWL